ncbi:kinase-like domain-containing protein [Phaeosphaeriaceae sp. PMI808]|nr:kinase-like domain-containing protein [Phaeosphaeriaceae sp. PMI808]
MIQVQETSQRYITVQGNLKFDHTQVLYLQDGMTFCGRLPFKLSEQRIDPERLEDVRLISSESFHPLHTPDYIVAETSARCFAKKPNTMSFKNGQDLANLLLQELATCEVIRNQPHPNVAAYYGCQVFNGRINGLCFKRYKETLMERINPKNLNKAMLMLAKDRVAARESAADCIPGIEDGIKHLHRLGIIHNDLNPANLMFEENGRLVIIDFDSSRASGIALDGVKRTYTWHDPEVLVSQESNDLNALEEVRTWLTSSTPADLQFGW